MDEEPILLHEADLMLALLRAGRRRSARLDDAAAMLEANLTAAREPAPADPEDLRRRLEEAARMLQGAAAIEPAGEGRFRLTEQGARLLAEHPDGVDRSVLAALPEFRAFVARRSRGGPRDDPRGIAYDAGMRAFLEGQPHDANPHPADSSDHLAWECGWAGARDARPR